MVAYANEPVEMPHLALIGGNPDFSQPVLVRIHSECMTGDVFGSARCDCGEQLHEAMRKAGTEGGIVFICVRKDEA